MLQSIEQFDREKAKK